MLLTKTRTMRFSSIVVALALIGVLAESAESHVIMMSHETRDGDRSIKSGPCGKSGSRRDDMVHIFKPGETIHLEWDEFVTHPGYFRISFDDDGHDSFVDPKAYNDLYTNDTVLADEIFLHEKADRPQSYGYDLTLPDIECDNCTIQLIQVMTDKPPYVSGTNDIYYNCLDVMLVPEPQQTPLVWLLITLGLIRYDVRFATTLFSRTILRQDLFHNSTVDIG